MSHRCVLAPIAAAHTLRVSYYDMSNSVAEEFIGTVDVWQLRQMRWPILRALARDFVEQCELERYMSGLLDTGHWDTVRVVPRTDPAARRPHLFDVYGSQPLESAFATA
jgi:hypothetical protein